MLFTPRTTSTWFVTEFDGQEVELGYFSLSELEAIEGPGGLHIERDLHFEPPSLSKVRQDPERMRDRPDGFTMHENNEEFHASANGSVASDHQVREPPLPFDRPGIHLIATRLDTAGLAVVSILYPLHRGGGPGALRGRKMRNERSLHENQQGKNRARRQEMGPILNPLPHLSVEA